MTTASLFSPDQFSGFDGSAGTAIPLSRYSLRQRYSVASGTPVSRCTYATLSAFSGISLRTTFSLNSREYFAISSPPCLHRLEDSFREGDIYPDRGGPFGSIRK